MAKRYAVIVGVTEYEDDQITPLQYTKNDALRLADLLIKNGEFAKERVYILASGIDEYQGTAIQTPTRGNVLQKVQYVANSADDGDLILFFFAGHGAEVSKHPYLLTSDTKMEVLRETAISVTTLNDMLAESKASCMVRLFDACRGPFGIGRNLMGRMTDVLQDAILRSADGWVSFSACSSGQQSYEPSDLEQGVFSYYLCEGLAGKAANDVGGVTMDHLVDYVKISLANWSDKQTLSQTPHIQSDYSGVLVLTTVGAVQEVVPPVTGDPLQALVLELGKQLSETPTDARNLVFTDKENYYKDLALLQEIVLESVRGFSSPAIAISTLDNETFPRIPGRAGQEFSRDMNDTKVSQEFGDQAVCIRVCFEGQEVVLPSSLLLVCLARFSFFYWIWYRHEYVQKGVTAGFSPQPKSTKGFYTLKPQALADRMKIKKCVTEIIERASADIANWAVQLRAHVNGRLDPLRQIGDIIE